jgi:hypothetical protein
VFHAEYGEVHVSERGRELGDVGAELGGVDNDDIDDEMLRRDDRREGVRDVLAEEMEDM